MIDQNHSAKQVADDHAAAQDLQKLLQQAREFSNQLSSDKDASATTLKSAKEQLDELKAKQQSIAEQITMLESQRGTMQALVETLNVLKADIEGKKSAVENDVQAIAQKAQEFSALKAQVENTANELATRQSSLDAKIGEVEGLLNQLKNEHTSLKQTLDAELPSFRQRVESEQTTLRQNIEGEQAKFRQAIEADQSALRQKLEELSTQFQMKYTEQQTDRAKEFTDKISELQQLTNKRIAEEAKAAEVIMAVLEKYEEQAKQVLGTVISTSQAGIYKLDAIEEGKGKKFFRAWASTFMLFAVAILVGPSVVEILKNGVLNVKVDWHDWLERLPISVVLFLPAFYFARESTRHSNNERKSKRLEQILSTIDPYLGLLDEKMRDPLKAKLAEQIFNPNETSSSPSDDEVKNFLTTLFDAIRTALKRD